MAQRGNSLVFTFVGQDRFSQVAGAVANKIGMLGKVAGVAAAGLGIFAAQGAKAFLDFDDRMNESLAIMGKISGPMKQRMVDAANEVGRTTRFSAGDAADAYFFLASAGFDAEQTLKGMPLVANFAQAGLIDMATGTELLVDALNALGLRTGDTATDMKNMKRVSDVLTKANVISNATIEEMAEALTNRAAPAMRNFNIPLEEGVAVLAALASQGIKGRRAGLGLSIMLRELSRRAITHKDAFEEANIAVFDQSGNMRNLGHIIRDLEDRFDGMSDKQKRAELMTLGFTDRSIQFILNVLGMSDAVIKNTKSFQGLGDTTEEIAQNQMKSFAARIDVVKAHVEELSRVLGKKLLEALFAIGEAVVPVGKELAAGIKKGVEQGEWGQLGDTIRETLSRVLSGSIDIGRKIIEVISGINWVTLGIEAGKIIIPLGIGLITGLINSITDPAMWRQLADNWQEILIATIGIAFAPAKLIGAVANILRKIPLVGRFMAWILESFASLSRKVVAPVLNFLGRMFGAFANGLTGGAAGKAIVALSGWLRLIPTRIGLFAVRAVEAMRGLISRVTGALLGSSGTAGSAVAKFIGFFATPLRVGFLALGAVIATVWNTIVNTIIPAMGQIGTAVINGWNRVREISVVVWNKIRSVISTVWNRISSIIGTSMKVAADLIGFFTALIVGDWEDAWNHLKGFFSGIWNALKQMVSTSLKIISSVIRTTWSFITAFFKKTFNFIKNLFSGWLDFLKSDSKSTWGSIKNFFVSIWKSMVSFLKSSLQRGKDFVVAAWKFILDRTRGFWSSVFETIRRFWGSILDNVRNFLGKIKDNLVNSWNFVLRNTRKAWNNIKNAVIRRGIDTLQWIRKLPGRIMNFLRDIPGKMLKLGRDIIGDLKKGLQDKWDDVKGFFSNVGSSIKDFLTPDIGNPFGGWEPGFGTAAPGGGVFASGKVLPGGSYSIGRGSSAHGYNARDLPAPTGTPVFAPFSGVARAKSVQGSYGNHVRIAGPGGLNFLAAHLSRFGNLGFVKQGQVIGYVGSTGNSTGPHLHMEPDIPGWYAKGGFPRPGSWGVVGEQGPELIKFEPRPRVFSNRQSRRMMEGQEEQHHDHDRQIVVENMNVQTYSGGRFSLREVEREMRFKGLR